MSFPQATTTTTIASPVCFHLPSPHLPRSIPSSHPRHRIFLSLHLTPHPTFRHRFRPSFAQVDAGPSPSQQQDESPPSFSSDDAEDIANCREILRVLELLKEKRDMPFNEVRLTIMIEDPREEERRELGVENERGCSRDDLAAALVEVYEGRIPSDRLVLRELLKEMLSWPNLEDEADSPSDPTSSPYAKSTDTGVDPRLKAQKLKVDWDEAAEIEPGEDSEDPNVPPVVGFSILYLVSAIPILIGVTVVAILFVNSFR